MSKNLANDSYPLKYEFWMTSKPLEIRVSLVPSLIMFLADNREALGSSLDAESFIIAEAEFGYRGIMKACEENPLLPGLPAYSFKIPKGLSEQWKLELFSQSVSEFTTLAAIFENESADMSIDNLRQYAVFDHIGRPAGELGEAGFTFTLSTEVLDHIGAYLWKNENAEAILEIMRRVFFRMLGEDQETRKIYDEEDFSVVPGYGCRDLIHLKVPGNSADVGTDTGRKKNRGHSFFPHNVDSYFQQLSLMSGVIRIVQMAREWADGHEN